MWSAGVLHSPFILNRNASYYGKIPYAGIRIESELDSVLKPTIKQNA